MITFLIKWKPLYIITDNEMMTNEITNSVIVFVSKFTQIYQAHKTFNKVLDVSRIFAYCNHHCFKVITVSSFLLKMEEMNEDIHLAWPKWPAGHMQPSKLFLRPLRSFNNVTRLPFDTLVTC
jgi:hypothetical protein